MTDMVTMIVEACHVHGVEITESEVEHPDQDTWTIHGSPWMTWLRSVEHAATGVQPRLP